MDQQTSYELAYAELQKIAREIETETVSVDVLAGPTRAAHIVSTRGVSRSFGVCGVRSYRFRVTELSGRGSVSLTVAKP